MSLSLILGFLPWILFGILSHHHPLAALLSALALSAFQVARNWQRPKVVEWVGFIFFLGFFIGQLVMPAGSLAGIAGQLVNGALTLMAFGSLAFGVPFTVQYAREQTPEEYWTSPLFIRINQVITAVWGVSFALQGVVYHWHVQCPDASAPTWISPSLTLAAIAFTGWYPGWSRKRFLQRQTEEA